jgi:amino-acid N-acetyltransferase
VHPAHLQKNIGSKLVEHALYEARLFSITRVFTLTYRPDFFRKFDFRVIERSKLPLKIWGECLHCVKFPDCDETAMLKEIEY